MVRSQWIGSVFGVLALTGLAGGQTTPIAAGPDGTKDRYVLVQETGKPAQRCKILKTWTNEDGKSAYQAQALDTGELMTIVETGPAAPPAATQTRSIAMRIFHWGWNAPMPLGTPEPPPNAVVVGYPIDLRPTTQETPSVASAPPPAPKPRGFWPSPFAQINASDLNVSAEHLAPPPPPAKKGELTPMAPSVVVTPAPTSPYAMKPAPGTVVKAPDAYSVASPWWVVWPARGTPPAPAVAATPATPKAPVVAKKVETTVPAPSDWRQSWGKADAAPDAPKLAPPHAETRIVDPLRAPDQFTQIPQKGGFVTDPPPAEKKAPLLAALALEQPPALPRPEGKEPQPHAASPVAAATPTPAAADTKPAAPAKPETAPPAVPLGLGSVLAAASPELAAPAAPGAAKGQDAVGIRADEPNAFTDRPRSGATASAPNAFSAQPPEAPPPDALAMNAFPTPPQAAPPSYTPAAVAIRTMPRSTAIPPQMPIGYVTPAGYHPESGYDLAQLSCLLRNSIYPSQREWAAEGLASMDWHQQPQIVDLLVERAKQDPAPTVRAECVRSLGRIKADTPTAVEAVKALRSDSDARVRQAADEAAGSAH